MMIARYAEHIAMVKAGLIVLKKINNMEFALGFMIGIMVVLAISKDKKDE